MSFKNSFNKYSGIVGEKEWNKHQRVRSRLHNSKESYWSLVMIVCGEEG